MGIFEPDARYHDRFDGRPLTDVMNPFTAHPSAVGETYLEHLRFAFAFGLRMLGGALAAMVHAVLPFVFITTASRTLDELNSLRSRGARAAPKVEP